MTISFPTGISTLIAIENHSFSKKSYFYFHMKETEFIRQNKKKWERFENLNATSDASPEELSDLYIDITDDLGYAQTHYHRRTVRVYLNQLGQKVFLGVNKFKRDSFFQALKQASVSIPIEIYKARQAMTFALIAFMVYVAIGVVSTHVDPDFPRLVMGDGYVDMTINNIEEGRPLNVYENGSQIYMMYEITFNNIEVAFLMFFAGFFFTALTHVLMFSNGVMLGAFQYYFKLKGLLITSFLGIWIHGAFEISALVIASGAGITAGSGWLFPGTLTRFQSMKSSVKRGLKIMVLVTLFLIFAGFFESFVTRHYDTLPDWSKLLIIAFSFLLIVLVMVVYPIYMAMKYPELVEKEEEVSQFTVFSIQLAGVKNSGELIRESLRFYASKFSAFFMPFFRIVFPLAIGGVLLRDFIYPEEASVSYFYDWAGQMANIMGFNFAHVIDFVQLVLWVFYFALIALSVLHIFYKAQNGTLRFWGFIKKFGAKVLLVSSFISVPVLLLPWQWIIPFVFVIPFLHLMIPTVIFEEKSLRESMKKAVSLGTKRYFTLILATAVMGALVAVFSQPIAFVFSIVYYGDKPETPDLLDMLTGFVERICNTYHFDTFFWSNIIRQFVYILFTLAVLPLFFIYSTFIYFAAKEVVDARTLTEDFKKFGKRDRYREMNEDENV